MMRPDNAASKRIITGFAAVLGMALMAFEAMPAHAAPPPHAPAWGYRRKQAVASARTYPRTRRSYSHRADHPNTVNDIDGDGIPNWRDRDIDGDGIPNNRDRDPYHRGQGARYARRPVQRTFPRLRREFGLPRPAHPVSHHQRVGRRDIDHDGIPNRRDRDIDGDGIRNRRDRDRDGDGIPNRRDRFDRRPNRR